MLTPEPELLWKFLGMNGPVIMHDDQHITDSRTNPVGYITEPARIDRVVAQPHFGALSQLRGPDTGKPLGLLVVELSEPRFTSHPPDPHQIWVILDRDPVLLRNVNHAVVTRDQQARVIREFFQQARDELLRPGQGIQPLPASHSVCVPTVVEAAFVGVDHLVVAQGPGYQIDECPVVALTPMCSVPPKANLWSPLSLNRARLTQPLVSPQERICW